MTEENIKNRDHILKVYFQMVSSREILNDHIDWNQFPEKTFARACRSEITNLTDTEISAVYNRYGDTMDTDSDEESNLNVFRLLKRVASELLTIRNDQPVCYYSRKHSNMSTL